MPARWWRHISFQVALAGAVIFAVLLCLVQLSGQRTADTDDVDQKSSPDAYRRMRLSLKGPPQSHHAEQLKHEAGEGIITVPFVVYPNDWFEYSTLFEIEGYGGWMLQEYAPSGVKFEFITYDQHETERFEEDLESFASGTVILLRSQHDVSSAVRNSTLYRKNDGCAYCWGQGNHLLYQKSLQKVLSSTTPFTIIYSGDWCCKTTLPPTSHQVLRTEAAANVMGNAGGTFPFGLQWANSTSFLEYLDENANTVARLPSRRSYAFSFTGTLSFRKPTRAAFKQSMAAQASSFDTILRSTDSGTQDLKYVIDAVEYGVGGYTYEEVTGLSYKGLLADTILALLPAGDAYNGGRIMQVLELGCIPVVEDFESYKGCDHPASAYKDLSAPFVYVKDWSRWNETVRSLLSDMDALDKQAIAVRQWWEDYKTQTVTRLVEFYLQAQQGLDVTHTCSATPTTAEQDTQALRTYNAYYSDATWWSSFVDSPEYCAVYCSTSIEGKEVTEDQACFSADCVPTPVQSFTCTVSDSAGNPATSLSSSSSLLAAAPHKRLDWAKLLNPWRLAEAGR